MPKHCAEFRNEPSQSLCNEISAIFGGTWCITVSRIRHFGGTCPPAPAGFTPLLRKACPGQKNQSTYYTMPNWQRLHTPSLI